jgi:hypothetical protein
MKLHLKIELILTYNNAEEVNEGDNQQVEGKHQLQSNLPMRSPVLKCHLFLVLP